MDFSKLGTKSWSEPGRVPQSKDAVGGFKADIEDGKVTNQIGDLLQLSRSRSNRQFVQASASTSALPTVNTGKLGATGGDASGRRSSGNESVAKKPAKHASTLSNVYERPATRLEIEALGAELQERIQAVLESGMRSASNTNVTAYDPHKDAVAMIRDRMLQEFGSSLQAVPDEPWLEDLIRCECVRDVCDSTASKLTDMLSVSSSEFGNVLRRLRQTYRTSHEQMRLGWASLRAQHVDTCHELEALRATNDQLEAALHESEQDIRSKIDLEVFEMRKAYEEERARDREHVLKTEHQMAEMSVTLRDLNALFKTMQGDADAAIASDTMARCRRLEQEVADLEQTVSVLAKTKEELHQEQKRCRHQEAEIRDLRIEVASLTSTVNRQDETIASLMGREAMHHAEIDKLKKMAAEAKEKEADLEFDQTATALLCIKCKKSLDDLSNIRDAVLGSIKPTEKLMCQNFRILLPNLKGRRPSRDSIWVRKCMRAILLSKMREVCALMPLGVAGQVTGFPEFVYAWFDPVIIPASGALTVGGNSTSKGSAAATAHIKADEDRWGFYYGVKSMSRENMEAKLVWSLLDQAQGEDGLAFVMNCLSIALSLGGNELWRQFGDTSGSDTVHGINFSNSSSKANASPVNQRNLPPTIWLRLDVAKHAVRLILVRALEPQMHATMDAIEALKESPDIENPLVPEEDDVDAVVMMKQFGEEVSESDLKKPNLLPAGPEPTHIDLFVWLRILLQRFQEEQSHRAAAIRLMFDTASVGALTAAPTQPVHGNNMTGTDYVSSVANGPGSESAVVASLGPNGAGGESHVEYPQFSAILKTLHASISASECAALFGVCYELGLRKVTANIFLKVAESTRLFSRAMRLVSLPLLRRKPDDYVAEVLAMEAAGAELGHGKLSRSIAAADRTEEVKPEGDKIIPNDDKQSSPRFASSSPTAVTVDIEQKVRRSLGAFIHSRVRMIEPEVHKMAKDLPERWRLVLLETYVDLNNAIVENFAKIRASQRAKNSADRNAGSALGASESEKLRAIQYHLDGIQPYLLYRKLLSFMLMFECLSDNPLLPGDLLSAPIASSAAARKGFGTSANGTTNCISLHNARSIICNIEHAVLGKRYKLSKIAKFEAVRQSISARRIQHTFMRIAGSIELVVPLPLRKLMLAGYVTGRGRGPSAGRALTQIGLRARKVYMEPWCAQAVVAEILYFKIMYDRKARSCNLPLLDLKLALLACHWSMWGCAELAELSIHDFCNAVRSYMHGLPRLRLFAAFLGFSDIEQPVSGILSTSLALTMYLQLILFIHQEVLSTLMEEGNRSEAAQTILFPCMENPLLRPDKRDFWKCDPEILLAAVQKWSIILPIHLRGGYTKLFDKLSSLIDRDGLLDVDDMLWVVMQHWAKSISAYTKRIEDQSSKIRVANKAAFKVYPFSKLDTAESKSIDDGPTINDRRLLVDIRRSQLPRYPSDIADVFNSFLESSKLVGSLDESQELLPPVDKSKIALIALKQFISPTIHCEVDILSKNTFLKADHKFRAAAIEKVDEKQSALNKLKPMDAVAKDAVDPMAAYLQELMLWDISMSCLGKAAGPPSNVSDAGASGSVDMFGALDAPSFVDKNGRLQTGENLLHSMPIASAVSATISMWHLVRLWSVLSGVVTSFLDNAGEELNKRIEASRSATASSKANASAAVMNKLASFGGTELVETDLTAVAAALAVYSDYLEDAAATSHSLHICCGTVDPMNTSGSRAMPRTSSTVVNPTTDYSDEATGEAWNQMRQLFTAVSKLSVALSIPFPYDEGSSKSTVGRKLQLEKASVYMVHIDTPQFSSGGLAALKK